MREIKFKAFDLANKKWVAKEPFAVIGECTMFNMVERYLEENRLPDDNSSLDVLCRTNISLMQFTGLTDKNGKEIYEGDIVRIDWLDKRYQPVVSCVTWNNEESCWDFGGGTPSEVYWSHEVIGNIHENETLLDT